MMELRDVYDKDRNLTGRTHVRGTPIPEGDYILVVDIWIRNAKGEYLISKRAPNKEPFPNQWECTGGASIAGDDSLTAALREVKEELGIDLDPLNGEMVRTIMDATSFRDIWLFEGEVDLKDIAFQEDETCDAKWADPDEIRRLMRDSLFVAVVYDYFEWLDDYRGPIAFFPDYEPESIAFAVTVALHEGKWVFVRHGERDTFEFPGGHVEAGESPEFAARRELSEESGAAEFELWPVCPYSVRRGDVVSSGLLCIADVTRFAEVPVDFEMAERRLFKDLPCALTYPAIIPKLLARAKQYMEVHATTVYFVRHAESDQSVHQDDIRPLNAKGIQDAAALVDLFNGIPLDAIYSSPYLRAEQTVMPLAVAHQLPIGEVWDLRERKVDAEWIEDWRGFAKKQWSDRDYKLSHGESLNEVARRNIDALNIILKKCAGQTIAIGTHGTALSTILCHYDPSFGYEQFLVLLPKIPCVVKMCFFGEQCIACEELSL